MIKLALAVAALVVGTSAWTTTASAQDSGRPRRDPGSDRSRVIEAFPDADVTGSIDAFPGGSMDEIPVMADRQVHRNGCLTRTYHFAPDKTVRVHSC
jgi:hypothetical protein